MVVWSVPKMVALKAYLLELEKAVEKDIDWVEKMAAVMAEQTVGKSVSTKAETKAVLKDGRTAVKSVGGWAVS